MTLHRPARGKQGFTTIELLVVVSIIAILMALTTAGVQRARQAARRAETTTECGQMSSAIATFKREKKVSHIPSIIVLREKLDYNLGNALERESWNYLVQVWPYIATLQGAFNNTGVVPGQHGIDWNGDNTIAPLNTAWTLEGDQCLVFFLGGIPGNGGMTGFSSNPRNPADTANRTSTFNFPASRLKLRTTAVGSYNNFNAYDVAFGNGNTTAGTVGFPSFTDPFTQRPYVYFSAHGRKNPPAGLVNQQTFGYLPFSASITDCGTLTGTGFIPYRDTATSYHQPSEFQIISAGSDKLYGNGGLTGSGATSAGTPDGDNISDFSKGQISGLSN